MENKNRYSMAINNYNGFRNNIGNLAHHENPYLPDMKSLAILLGDNMS